MPGVSSRVVQSPDDDLAFERIINLPRRGIGIATVRCSMKSGGGRVYPPRPRAGYRDGRT